LTEFIVWFVQHPLRILALGVLYFFAWGLARAGLALPRANALLLPATFCLAFAGWEWLVLLRTPDADIRVDLLLIWPALLMATAWALWRILRR
jgi:hypothetical protein